MSTPKPQQPTGSQDETDDLISELARMMGNDAEEKRPEAESEAASVAAEPSSAPAPTPAQPVNAVRVPGEAARPAAAPSGFKFDFGAPPSAPSVAAPAPLVSWQDRLNRTAAPSSPVRLEPTLERVPVEPVTDMPSFVAPAKPEPAAAAPTAATPRPAPEVQPAPEPEPVPATTSDHDAIADLIAAEFEAPAAAEPVAPEPANEPEPPVAKAPEPPASKPVLRTVNFPAPPKPENDRFASPPVFGAGARPIDRTPEAPVPPAPEARAEAKALDPMDEIESLIGAAVQANRGVRSVVTPTAVQRPPVATPAAPVDDDAAHMAAEAAILAAAAAAGVEVSRVAAEPRFDEAAAPKPGRRQRARPVREPRERRGGFRPFLGPVIAAVLLIAAGIGLYWVLGMGHSDGTAPLLTADNSPAKEAPPTPAPTVNAPNPASSAVFNELDGVKPTTDDEQLVSRDQSTGNEATPTAIQATDDGDGLANRKVRTVTVRPDGTIVETESGQAGSQVLPVTRPNVPDVPSGGLDNSDLLTAAAEQPASTPVAQPAASTPAAETPALIAAGGVPTPAGVVAPTPMPRPSDRAALQQPNASVTAIVAPAAQGGSPANDLIGNIAAQNSQPSTPAATPPARSNAPAYVQLSSQRDQSVAQQSLVGINDRYGSILKGVLPEVQRVDLGAKGVYYRVRVPTDSLQSANYLCSQIKAASGDCLVTN